MVHRGAVDIILREEYYVLRCNDNQDVCLQDIGRILKLRNKLIEYYSQIEYIKFGEENMQCVSATDTLISKVMLGTLACVPAYDQNFKRGLREHNLTPRIFNQNSLAILFSFVEGHHDEITQAQDLIVQQTNQYYPIMKILDIYF